jgi:Putative prokaryotic signal transducing protein
MSADFIDYEEILEIHNPGDQAFIKSLFDAEGITYFCQGEYVAPYLFHALPVRLLVKKDQVAKAREILQDMEFTTAYSGLKRPAPSKDRE